MTVDFRSYAIVPACGHSRRMGTHKLLLPWKDGTVVDAVLQAWLSSIVDRVIVVVRPDDESLRQRCLSWNVDIVQPRPAPEEMKGSIQCGLDHIADSYAPAESDAWLTAPADMPLLTAALIDRLLASYDTTSPSVLVPRHGDQRGHPILLPWLLRQSVHDLGNSEGLNVLVARGPTRCVPVTAAELITDMDSPREYERLQAEVRAAADGRQTRTSAGDDDG